MKFANLIAVFALLVATAECLFFDGGTLVISTGALAGLVALKAAAFGGLAIGAALGGAGRRRSYSSRRYSRRYGRSVGDESESLLLDASINDGDDCAKKLVCLLNSADADSLFEDEKVIVDMFGKNGEIDVTSVTVEFDLAAVLGRKAGEDRCKLIFSRCPHKSAKDLMDVIRQPQLQYYNKV